MPDPLPLGGTAPLVPHSDPGLPCTIPPGGSVLLDWGRKRTGWVTLAGHGKLGFVYAADREMLELVARCADGGYAHDAPPTYICARPRGDLTLAENGTALHEPIAALRWLRLTNAGPEPVRLSAVSLRPSEPAAQPLGSFACDDQLLTTAWRMGIDTVHLCTQPGEESLNPVFAPFGSRHVQWDGCRRDREVWGGDLRTGALAWNYNFADPDPIANSLYLIMSGQHIGCSEHGLYPGSASSHLTFYEWAFWEVVALREHHLFTGDERLMRFARLSLPKFLTWCEKRFAESGDGWLHGDRSWMYSLRFARQAMPSLQAVAVLAFQAMVELFGELGDAANQERARGMHAKLAERFHATFWDPALGAYPFLAQDPGGVRRSDLCTNAWAVLAGLVPAELRSQVLANLSQRHWTAKGSLNLIPEYTGLQSGHSDFIWPYANAYEVAARFHAGNAAGAMEVLRRYTAAHVARDHHTVWEAMTRDGGLPVQGDPYGTLSLCHAWAGIGSWALQRHVLGLAPLTPGWRTFSVTPQLGLLTRASGAVVTPHGLISIELEVHGGALRGVLRHPAGTKPEAVPAGISVVTV